MNTGHQLLSQEYTGETIGDLEQDLISAIDGGVVTVDPLSGFAEGTFVVKMFWIPSEDPKK